jgi:diguanylate cyclase (GGDEF)-like protein
MPPEAAAARRRQRAHRLLFTILIGVLVAFSAWSVRTLAHTQRLRGELDLYLGWIGEVRTLRGELAQVLENRSRTESGGPTSAVPRFETPAIRRMLERAGDPALRVALQNLRSAVGDLETQAAAGSSDALWQSAVAALAAAEAVDEQLRGQVARLNRRLGVHWRSVWLLVAGALLLAASNLVLLIRIHQRRLELEKVHGEALRSARHDSLTGLWNREGILRLLGHELVRSRRSLAPLGVILADVDDFRAVNNLLGQDQGDFILRQVGARLQSLVRPYDTMGRFGGDAFLIVLPACDPTATEHVVRRLRRAVNERDVEHALGHLRVTLTLAHATVDQAAETDVDTLLRELEQGITACKTRPEMMLGRT